MQRKQREEDKQQTSEERSFGTPSLFQETSLLSRFDRDKLCYETLRGSGDSPEWSATSPYTTIAALFDSIVVCALGLAGVLLGLSHTNTRCAATSPALITKHDTRHSPILSSCERLTITYWSRNRKVLYFIQHSADRTRRRLRRLPFLRSPIRDTLLGPCICVVNPCVRV